MDLEKHIFKYGIQVFVALLLLDIVWKGLEIMLDGRVMERTSDTIIGLLFANCIVILFNNRNKIFNKGE